MVTTKQPEKRSRAAPEWRRTGYLAAVIVNAIMLVIVNNILEWGWLPFLTAEFADLIWLINVSLVATIVANVAYMSYDPPWFKSLTQIGLNLISIVVLIRTLQVFPFDFTTYSVDWATLLRVALSLGIFGTAIAVVVELVKLVGSLTRARESESS